MHRCWSMGVIVCLMFLLTGTASAQEATPYQAPCLAPQIALDSATSQAISDIGDIIALYGPGLTIEAGRFVQIHGSQALTDLSILLATHGPEALQSVAIFTATHGADAVSELGVIIETHGSEFLVGLGDFTSDHGPGMLTAVGQFTETHGATGVQGFGAAVAEFGPDAMIAIGQATDQMEGNVRFNLLGFNININLGQIGDWLSRRFSQELPAMTEASGRWIEEHGEAAMQGMGVFMQDHAYVMDDLGNFIETYGSDAIRELGVLTSEHGSPAVRAAGNFLAAYGDDIVTGAAFLVDTYGVNGVRFAGSFVATYGATFIRTVGNLTQEHLSALPFLISNIADEFALITTDVAFYDPVLTPILADLELLATDSLTIIQDLYLLLTTLTDSHTEITASQLNCLLVRLNDMTIRAYSITTRTLEAAISGCVNGNNPRLPFSRGVIGTTIAMANSAADLYTITTDVNETIVRSYSPQGTVVNLTSATAAEYNAPLTTTADYMQIAYDTLNSIIC